MREPAFHIKSESLLRPILLRRSNAPLGSPRSCACGPWRSLSNFTIRIHIRISFKYLAQLLGVLWRSKFSIFASPYSENFRPFNKVVFSSSLTHSKILKSSTNIAWCGIVLRNRLEIGAVPLRPNPSLPLPLGNRAVPLRPWPPLVLRLARQLNCGKSILIWETRYPLYRLVSLR